MFSKIVTISLYSLILLTANCSHSIKVITQENALMKLHCFSVQLPLNDWKVKNEGNDKVEILKQIKNEEYEMGYNLLTGAAAELQNLNINSNKEYINYLIDKELKKQNSNVKDSIIKRERIGTYSDNKFYYGIKTISESNNKYTISYCHFVVPGKADAMKVIHCYYSETGEKPMNGNRVTDEYLKSIMSIKVNQECFSIAMN